MKDLLAHLLKRPADLLSFDEVHDRLRLKRVVDRGTAEVPLDRIVGTLGREREFNRAFLPREESLRDRWDDVKELAEGAAGFPPVELYLVGETYFVVDGHHRVSVAKSLGAPSIEARVKEFMTPVPLEPETSVEDLILKEGLADFLDATGLAPEQPDEFRTTEANGYEKLLDHVSVHRYFRGIETGSGVSTSDAAASWRDIVYRPMIETIRASGVIEDFPGRTETDLYLFTTEHLHYLRQRYGEDAVPQAVGVRHFKMTQRRARAKKQGAKKKPLWTRKK
jgi:hypothetical protein